MLGKMLIHGLVGAAVIGSAAAVFAQAKDNGYLKPDALPAVLTDKAKPAGDQQVGTAAAKDNGYLTAPKRGHEKAKHEHRREGRHHDDDDDD